MLCIVVDTHHLVGIDGQQADTVEVNLTLGHIGREVVTLREAQQLADFTVAGNWQAEPVVVGLAVDVELHGHAFI